MRVTFDTKSLAAVVSPETSQRPIDSADAAKVRAAIQAGDIQGFFCEAHVAIEGIEIKDRPEVLGSTHLDSRFEDSGEDKITLTLTVEHWRKQLHPEFLARVKGARELGMRALRGPARIVALRIRDEDGTFFAPDDSMTQLLARMDKVNELATAIDACGVGHARAQSLGVTLSKRAGVSKPELWYQGLRSGKLNEVKEAVAEWADGDCIASHYGYGIDLFCTEDCARNAGKESVLHPNNRQWLSEKFGIQFMTLAGLAAMLP
jgi:phosphoribosyl-AMP cyclohydrolase